MNTTGDTVAKPIGAVTFQPHSTFQPHQAQRSPYGQGQDTQNDAEKVRHVLEVLNATDSDHQAVCMMFRQFQIELQSVIVSK